MITKAEDVRIPYGTIDQFRVTAKVKDSKTDPPYYRRWKIQPLDFCMANDLPFWLGNVVKYCMRYDQKNGLEDLKKARVYLDKKISELEAQ